MAAPKPMARKAIMAGMGGWDRSCRHSNADDAIHIRHQDHVRLAEIDAELERFQLPRHQADVVDTATELSRRQRTAALTLPYIASLMMPVSRVSTSPSAFFSAGFEVGPGLRYAM